MKNLFEENESTKEEIFTQKNKTTKELFVEDQNENEKNENEKNENVKKILKNAMCGMQKNRIDSFTQLPKEDFEAKYMEYVRLEHWNTYTPTGGQILVMRIPTNHESYRIKSLCLYYECDIPTNPTIYRLLNSNTTIEEYDEFGMNLLKQHQKQLWKQWYQGNINDHYGAQFVKTIQFGYFSTDNWFNNAYVIEIHFDGVIKLPRVMASIEYNAIKYCMAKSEQNLFLVPSLQKTEMMNIEDNKIYELALQRASIASCIIINTNKPIKYNPIMQIHGIKIPFSMEQIDTNWYALKFYDGEACQTEYPKDLFIDSTRADNLSLQFSDSIKILETYVWNHALHVEYCGQSVNMFC
jgi:hypothetical protein